MTIPFFTATVFEQEARSLLTRVARLRPFALLETMVPAANLRPRAQRAIERRLAAGRREIEQGVAAYLAWLRRDGVPRATPEEAQRRLCLLRLRWGAVLAEFDLFGDVVTQRSEHETGIWLAGLDAAAADGLRLPRTLSPPPVLCYLDRGAGGAIRRARTRLPTGAANPVAVIRVPRERMVGTGIASSLMHEVGHQASALLDLPHSLRVLLRSLARGAPRRAHIWQWWERWISEILADFWAVAQVGIASTIGLIAVVSLPRSFVFRVRADDPHPAPFLRVHLSCAIGHELFPHPQWARWSQLWDAMYPRTGLAPGERQLLGELRAGIPALAGLLAQHRPRTLAGRSLKEALGVAERQPRHLAGMYRSWLRAPARMYRTAPALAFAVLGQARSDHQLSVELESELIARLLRHWALSTALRPACAPNQPTFP